jgi:hypothetical protein
MKKKLEWRARAGSFGCALACAVGALGFAGEANATYVITDLGDASWFYNGGGSGIHGNSLQYRLSINNKNEVVGTGTNTAYYWANGAYQKLTGYGNVAGGQTNITANDINDSSVIVGRCTGSGCNVSTSDAITRNGPTGTWSALPGPGGQARIYGDAAFGINASGGIVGQNNNPSNYLVPYSFTPAQYVGVIFGEAWAINDNGAVITNYGSGASVVHSSIFDAVGVQLHSSDTALVQTGRDYNFAADINNQGIIVGSSYSYLGGGGVVGFRASAWDSNGNFIDLGAPGRNSNYSSYASAINESGLAVGGVRNLFSTDDTDTFAAVFQGGQTYNLGSLVGLAAAGWTQLYSATDINEAGSIVGFGLKDGEVRAYLLTVASVIDPNPNGVPLPAPLALLALGLLGLPRALRKQS